MKKKERHKRQLTQQLHIKNERGEIFVGCRPVTFASKKHPSRAKRKAMERSEMGRFFHGPYYIDNVTPEAPVTCFSIILSFLLMHYNVGTIQFG